MTYNGSCKSVDKVPKTESHIRMNDSSCPLKVPSQRTPHRASVSCGFSSDLNDASKIASTLPDEADEWKHASPINLLADSIHSHHSLHRESLATDAKLPHCKHFGDAFDDKILDVGMHHQNKSEERTNIAEVKAALASLELRLGSLARTKESIGRTTRIAVDCIKFGCASEVLSFFVINSYPYD